MKQMCNAGLNELNKGEAPPVRTCLSGMSGI